MVQGSTEVYPSFCCPESCRTIWFGNEEKMADEKMTQNGESIMNELLVDLFTSFSGSLGTLYGCGLIGHCEPRF
jgi:hypothetical protein